MNATILLVEDEVYVRESITAWLTRKGFRVREAGSLAEARRSHASEGADAVVVDLRLTDGDGGELVEEWGRDPSAPPTIVLTGHGHVRSAVECLKAGAAEYLLKPVDPDELVLVLERVIGHRRQARELENLRADEHEPVGSSTAWRQAVALADAAAASDCAVLLIGESGSGKEELAKRIHRRSARASAAFVAVNCAAVPEGLFESELFGHRRGAFTGAVADREGRFKLADGGTLLFDEVDSLSLGNQAKLLRAVESGSFERVGESRSTSVDVRILAATNTDLALGLAADRFRSDLYYRLNVFSITVPPLRERPEDVLALARHFLRLLAPRLGSRVNSLGPDAEAALLAHPWPGNVRELRNAVERALLVERGPQLSAASLPLRAAAETIDALALRPALARAERELLATALARAGGVRRRAAELLRIDERNLAYFLKKHGLGSKRRRNHRGDA